MGAPLRLWACRWTGSEDDIGGILKVERLDAFRVREISLLALSQSESDVWVIEEKPSDGLR